MVFILNLGPAISCQCTAHMLRRQSDRWLQGSQGHQPRACLHICQAQKTFTASVSHPQKPYQTPPAPQRLARALDMAQALSATSLPALPWIPSLSCSSLWTCRLQMCPRAPSPRLRSLQVLPCSRFESSKLADTSSSVRALYVLAVVLIRTVSVAGV